ncbi:uncharacterized protein LOC126685900 [Mercurialis annua]|uniref:uncharacterized protein LOC126685900 n=1 Tax=Mercurialis annua TaxID=3986 RepID=UPI002160A297|nr:uncharacterized protein LOC126685900 [Mercurialis annua]
MTMMSMFSSFDALCAEFYGQKLKLSGGPSSDQQRNPKILDSLIEKSETEGKEKSLVSSALRKVKGSPSPPQERRRPRFAPELDGVHCFETILPY